MMKGLLLQCVYDVDDEKFPYVAFDYQGRLFGFVNPPVRDFSMREWVDCVTGDTGELIPYTQWDQSLRYPKDFVDIHRKKPGYATTPKSTSVHGKKGVVSGEGDFTKYKYKLIDARKKR